MAAKAIFKSVCGLTIAIAFAACGGNGIEGEWVEPIPGMETQMQGVLLFCTLYTGSAGSTRRHCCIYLGRIESGGMDEQGIHKVF